MAIRTVVTRGYGNGTFNGTIPLIVTRGYSIGVADLLEASNQNIAFLSIKSRMQAAPLKNRVLSADIKDRVNAAPLKGRTIPAPLKNRVKTS